MVLVPGDCEEPLVIINESALDSKWRHVPTKMQGGPLRPAFPQLHGMGACLVIEGEPQSLLSGAIASKTFISAANLKSLVTALGCGLPERGSGKSGGIVKKDLAAVLVKHVFPHVPEEEMAAMAAAIVTKSKARLEEDELEAVKILQSLDLANARDSSVEKLMSMAKKRLDDNKRKKDKDSAKEEGRREAEAERLQRKREKKERKKNDPETKGQKRKRKEMEDAAVAGPAAGNEDAAVAGPAAGNDELPASQASVASSNRRREADARAPPRVGVTPAMITLRSLLPDGTKCPGYIVIGRDPDSYGYRVQCSDDGFLVAFLN